MDRYQNLDLDLDLECDGGNSTQKTVSIKGMFKKSSKSGKHSQAQDSLSANSELSKSDDSLTGSINAKDKGGLFQGMLKKTTKAAKEDQPQAIISLQNVELSASSDSLTESNEKSKDKSSVILKPGHVQRPSQDILDTKLSVSEDSLLENTNSKVKSNMTQQEMRERSETPPVLPTEEGIKQTSTYDKVKPRVTENNQDKQNMISRQKNEPPIVAPKPSAKAVSKDEWPKEEEQSSAKEEKKEEEEGKEKTEETKLKKPKRQNPFMPQVKAKLRQRGAQDGAAGTTAENEGGNRSLFDQLDDFCTEPVSQDSQDVENLMEWWKTVESWEDTPQDDDMTEKEEAKAFAVTAHKVQKGIRVFNKLFSERAESLWQHVIDLHSIADGLDKFNKNTKIAQITGGSTSAVGGIATIAGLALAPVTMGTSLIVTAVGLGVATAGGLTSAGAGISNQVNNSMDRKKVEKLVEDYQEKILDLNKCLKFIQQGIENLRKFDLMKMKKHAYNRDFPVLTSSLYEDGAMAGKAILSNANEIMRVVQIAHVAGSSAARAVQVASMATGVLTGLFVGMDIYFVAKDSKELKKGAKSEFAAKIREVATQLHDGLVELNRIRLELQSSTQENKAGKDEASLHENQKDGKYKEDDLITKPIKKDIKNHKYV